jgi:hypothetical protein
MRTDPPTPIGDFIATDNGGGSFTVTFGNFTQEEGIDYRLMMVVGSTKTDVGAAEPSAEVVLSDVPEGAGFEVATLWTPEITDPPTVTVDGGYIIVTAPDFTPEYNCAYTVVTEDSGQEIEERPIAPLGQEVYGFVQTLRFAIRVRVFMRNVISAFAATP